MKRNPNRNRLIPSTYTVAEMSDLLKYCPPSWRACIALSGFAGLRAAEILQLDWSDIDLSAGRAITKGASKSHIRCVALSPNLLSWLANSRPSADGRIWQKSKAAYLAAKHATVTAINAARETKAGRFEWVPNALRHSFVSYYYALTQDCEQVACVAGISSRMVMNHFIRPCSLAEARAWFAIVP